MGQGRKFSIREVSEICNIPSKTLRYYDEIALVVPEFRDESSRYRYYSKDQIITLCIIRKLRKMGFGLKAIQCIISGNTATDLERNIETKLDEIAEEINSLERTYYSMKAFMERLKNGVDLLNIKESLEVEDVSIETIRPTNLVYTRKTMANYANAEVSLDRWVELSNLCDELDLKSDGSYIVTYHSNPLEQFLYTDTDIEFGISVEDVGEAKEFRTFGNFTAATAIHLGNYADIMQTHVRLVQWINKNQYKIVGPVSEEFIISPLDINNINEHVTKIIIPVEKIQKNKEV
jgi:DNA-binding transcriptional MerR regulator